MYQVNLELIKERRKTKGYSLKKMSDFMGFNDKAKYYRRETGEYNFKPEELPYLAKLLDIPLAKIFTHKVSKIETSDKERRNTK
ncbi:helix-turn-helix transcriptional regulator [Enterococcus faecium]|uniref:helix-turn-helix domain-containing protein n=1 Tax=Enterococcus faecium TaxID=1352 RepID=UPI001561377D|nr:helix-turn-helix transcriptional regulator [Enterococcus faecium]EGP5037748.1 helix-turn-helix transcriptional regulator [Enterococcus faecium]EME5369392.1 helix-turn-helix transcriptional regulator [Enterococcus faecium]MDB7248880.1 helix-turn-helix transcriptional regulator [Enterococcus faecium]MDB7253985.1 helix-turn-helix transcriptional regulator [Enterococcus faecium]MDB7256494.1 helix-turn-helix transcriptional regulator [Enterococcus faecium]